MLACLSKECVLLYHKNRKTLLSHTLMYTHIDERQSFLFWFPWYFKGEHLHLCKFITAWMHSSKCKRRHYLLLHMQILLWMLMLLRIIRDFFCNWKTTIKYLTGELSLYFFQNQSCAIIILCCLHNRQNQNSKWKTALKKGEKIS